jgi:hypothetical protein
MVTTTIDADPIENFDEFATRRFEKMSRPYRFWMPSRRTRPAQNASVRTPAARRAAHEVSKRVGGKHRRRRRTWNHPRIGASTESA